MSGIMQETEGVGRVPPALNPSFCMAGHRGLPCHRPQAANQSKGEHAICLLLYRSSASLSMPGSGLLAPRKA